MAGQMIENIISETFSKEMRRDLLGFISYLREHEMLFERGKGYWENQFYWMVNFRNEYVCFILVNGSGAEEKFSPLTIWADDSGSNWYENFPLDTRTKEFAWKNIDFCENCGSCGGGTCKTVFGKAFTNVCRTTMRFVNPDNGTLKFIKKMIEIRKNDILTMANQTK